MIEASYFVTTPYIDAYYRFSSASFEEFDRMMKKQALNWGEAGLGHALLLGDPVPEADDGLVLAIGTWNDTSYALVATPGAGWYDTRRIIEFNYPREWNVT